MRIGAISSFALTPHSLNNEVARGSPGEYIPQKSDLRIRRSLIIRAVAARRDWHSFPTD
jgi:hypothetical protein